MEGAPVRCLHTSCGVSEIERVVYFLSLQWSKPNPTRYRSCSVDVTQSDPQPNSWLISDQFPVSKANRIDITVEYYFRRCSDLPSNGGYYCNHTFGLYENQSDQEIKDQAQYPDPLINPAAYEKVAEISQPIDSRTSVTIKSRVKRRHVLLAFHNSGACITLYSVKVSYNFCPTETHKDSLVTLPRTVAPANDSAPNPVEGNCDKDTVRAQGSLSAHCKSNGEWDTSGFEGRCVCKEDMENVGGKCQGILYGQSESLLIDN